MSHYLWECREGAGARASWEVQAVLIEVEMSKYFIFILSLMISGQANAYHFCKGKIKTVWTEGNGSVYIVGSWRNAHTKICNINSAWNNIQPEVCKVWVSTVHLAYAAKSDVTVRYHEADSESCAQLTTYGSAPAPNYIMLTERD